MNRSESTVCVSAMTMPAILAFICVSLPLGDVRADSERPVELQTAADAKMERRRRAYGRVNGRVERLADPNSPFLIKESTRLIANHAELVEFLDDIYELHGAERDRGFEVPKINEFGGGTNYEIRRVISGVPVIGSNTIVTVGSDGAVVGAYGMLYDAATRVSVLPHISRTGAAANCEAKFAAIGHSDSELGDKLSLAFVAKDGLLYLNWVARTRLPGSGEIADCFVDAKTGRASVKARNSHALNRRIYDETIPMSQVIVRQEGDPPTGDIDADTAYDLLAEFYNFFLTQHGRDGYDDNGILMQIAVHAFANASNNWDSSVFADWEANENYHPGALVYPARDPDIVHHESAHNLVGHEVELHSTREAEAVREALADVFAASIASSKAGWSTADSIWQIGEQSFSNGALRYMHDPNAHSGVAWYHNIWLTDDIYQQSGVVSMMFHLLAKGGTNPVANTIDRRLQLIPPILVDGIGVSNAEKLMYFTIDQGFLADHANIILANIAVESAAEFYFFGDLQKQQSVNDAWAAVGFYDPEPEYEMYWLPICWGESFFTVSIEIGELMGAQSYRIISSPLICWAIAAIGGN